MVPACSVRRVRVVPVGPVVSVPSKAGGDRVEMSDVCDVVPPYLADRMVGEARQLGGAGATLDAIVDELGKMAATGAVLCVLRFAVAPSLQSEAIEWAANELVPRLG